MSKKEKTWIEHIRDAYKGKSNSIDASYEVINYLFKKHLNIDPDKLKKMKPKRVAAWLELIRLDIETEAKKTEKIIEAIYKIGGFRRK